MSVKESRGREGAVESAGGPLEGRTVVVTRPRDQAADLVEPLEARGARVVLFPTIEIVPPADPEPLRRAAREVEGYDWIVFTSVNGVEAFAGVLREVGGDGMAGSAGAPPTGNLERAAGDGMARPARPKICAIGPATGDAATEAGFPPDLIPDEYVAEAVVEAMAQDADLAGARILQPRAAVARSVLPEGLRARGAEVDVVEAYRAVRPDGDVARIRRLLDEGAVDLVTFTASSTVRNFHEMVDPDDPSRVRVAAIGPITAGTARELGYDVVLVAEEYTIPGLVEACEAWGRERGGAS